LHSALLEQFLPVLHRLPSPVQLSNDLAEAFTIQEEGALRVVWAPFGYLQEGARVVLVGITPGRYQAEQALSTLADALAEGLGLDDAVRRVKTTASFSGPLRANLVAMLDHIGLQELLKLNTCAALFRPGGEFVHFTSALRYPVFVNGINYAGTPDLLRTKMLRDWVDAALAEEARRLPSAVWIPLGPKPAKALRYLADQNLIEPMKILDGLPHPSGANAERIGFFLGRKARSTLSRNTSPEGIEVARDKLRDKVKALS
jgi:hypothetical protein